MGTNVKIWIALGIAVIMAIAGVWQIVNVRGAKARGRRRAAPLPEPKQATQQRNSDSRSLSGPEKRLYTEAQRLLGQNKTASAARILEQLGMQREAIQALEDQGLIHEAAKILTRMQRHNRAGVVYARHGMWENAAQCFKLANMPLEVAKCAREAGDLAMAAEHFEKVGRFEDAGECYEQLGDYHRSAQLFANVGKLPQAMAMYNRLAATATNLASIDFHEKELQAIIDFLSEGNTDRGLAAVLMTHNRLSEAVLNLINKQQVKQASELYKRAGSDLGPVLMGEINYQSGAGQALAEVFQMANAYHYSGMVLERMAVFDRAAEAFEEAEDFERAAYCYERAGMEYKVKPLKEKAKLNPYRAEGAGKHAAGFALADIGGSDAGSTSEADEETDGNNESTRMLTVTPDDSDDSASDDSDDSHQDEDDDRPPPPRDEAGAPKTPPAPLKQQFHEAPRLTPLPAAGAKGNFRLTDEATLAKADPQSSPPVPRVAPPPPRLTPPPPEMEIPQLDMTPAAPPVAHDHQPSDAQVLPLEEGHGAFQRARFFADLDFDQKNRIWSVGTTLSFSAEETILTYNDEPRGVYVIIKGSVSCYKDVGGKEAYVDQMGEAESFGELWLLADQPTAVRFVAGKDTKIRVIGRDAFTALLDRDGTIARKLYKRFTMRLLKRLLRPQNNNKNQQAS